MYSFLSPEHDGKEAADGEDGLGGERARTLVVRMEGEDSREQIRAHRTWRLFGSGMDGRERSQVESEISTESH